MFRSFMLPLLALSAALSAGTPSLAIKVDNFGYRPADSKVAIFTSDPGATVQVRNTSDTVLYTVPTDGGSIVNAGADAHSGDNVWQVTFSGFTTAGTYRLYSAALGAQSYDFEIREDIYNGPGLAALKTYYYQRCGVAHPAAYAGANWADAGVCHAGDTAATAHPGHTSVGTKDLSGGWHDAGDYNKYAWYAATDSVYFMLRAYEDNPAVFSDNQLNIPESGNGRPDILDEVKVELDWLLKMQLPSGAVLDRVRAQDGVYTSASPPSGDSTVRYYKDPTNDSAAAFAASVAIGARVFAAYGDAAYAATLTTAANLSWAWLQARSVTADEAVEKVLAAAEVFRNDPTQTTARTYVDGYQANWATYFLNMDSADTWAAHTYVRTPAATAGVVTAMRTAINTSVNYIFSNDDKYLNGMTNWYYYWGSNRPRQKHGLFLLHARQLGIHGSRTSQQVLDKAKDYLHYFHGRNALNMVFLTNMSSFGGEHSSYMFYHGWFGPSWSAAYGRPRFLGKPAAVSEPHYPYYAGTDNYGVNDNRAATYGPAPGFIPGGPNAGYSGGSVPPSGITYRSKAYRDWAWQEAGSPASWEITENSLSSQGPYVALAAYFMQPSVAYSPTPTPSITPDFTHTASPTASPTACPAPINMAEALNENGTWAGANATRLTVSAGSAPAGAVTQGGSALRVSVTVGATWNDAIMNLTGFSPAVLAGATHLSLDLYVSPELAGSAFNTLFLYGACASCSKWYEPLSTVNINLVAGANTVSFPLDYSGGLMLPTDPISTLILIHNRASAATGFLYIDNVRLEGVCWTPTPTRSPTRTASATRTPSPTATETRTPSPTRSATATATPTSSSTESPTATPSPTDVPVGSSPTDSPTSSPVQSATSSATPTSTPTAALVSPTITDTPTPVLNSPTPSPMDSATLTFTPTPSPSSSVTPAFSPTDSPTAAPATALPTGDALVIEALQGFPQPDPTAVLLKLQGRAERVVVRIYSPAWVLLAELEGGAAGPGWTRLDLRPIADRLPRGISYLSAQAFRGAVRSQPQKAPLYRLR